jgi:methionyl-tRNA formyltransferase
MGLNMGFMDENSVIVAGYGSPCILGIQVFFSLGLKPSQISLLTHSADESNLPSWDFAKANQIEVVDYKSTSDELFLWVNKKKPSIIVSLHYRDRIPATVLNIPKYGGINLHPSLLPEYKGCFSIPWAIINGEEKMGFTYHYMTEQFDKGNILYQEEISIHNDDTSFSLFHKLIIKGINRLDLVLRKVIEEGSPGKKQENVGSYYPRKVPFDGYVNVEWDNTRIDRFVRSMYFPPHRGAMINVGGREIELQSMQDYIDIMDRK